jgi:deaminated glutathione amidase
VAAMSAWAARHGVAIVGGSITERRDGYEKCFNTCVVVDPDGEVSAVYRKIHLFDVEVGGVRYWESEAEQPGEEPVLAEVHDWGVGLSICYDLRFPELSRILAVRGATVLTVPAAFTETTTRDHWEVLLRARAMENQAFVVAANQVGEHPPGLRSGGRSMIIDPWGVVLAQAPDDEGVIVADLDYERQDEVRAKLPALAHRRDRLFDQVHA